MAERRRVVVDVGDRAAVSLKADARQGGVGEPGLTEKEMFGGLAFLVGGTMASAATAPARHAIRESGLTCILDGPMKLIAERTPADRD